MPSVIDRIRSELDARGVTYEVSATAISVPVSTPKGFRVTLVAPDERGYEVRCEQWRERFDRAEDAYDCTLLALSNSCRLRVVRRGAAAVEWRIERREYGGCGRPVRVSSDCGCRSGGRRTSSICKTTSSTAWKLEPLSHEPN